MKNVKYLMVVSCVSVVALAGCEIPEGPFGVHPLIEGDEFEKIDLVAVLTGGAEEFEETDNLHDKQQQLERAFADFNEDTKDETERERARNRVQERILAASNQVCGDYKHELKQLDAYVNFGLGSLTTALAGAGAIFTGADIVRALSGSAAITSGVRAEFNEDFFQQLTIQVITDGLESKRREIYDQILKNRGEDLTEYPVQRAIKDAIEYHENCSLLAGLEQAALAIERNENPGAEAMTRFLKKMGDTRSALDVLTGKPRVGVAAANKDLPQLYVSLDDSQQTKSTVQSDVDKRLKIPADREEDTVARAAEKTWKAEVAKAFKAFDTAYAKILKTTGEIAAKVLKFTAKIEDKKTTKDQRNIKIAELAVQQANIRVQENELNRAEQTLASSLENALKAFETAMAKVEAKIKAKAALKKAQAGGNADAIAKAQADLEAKTKAAEAAAKAN